MKLRRRWYDWLLFGLALAVLLAATVYVFVVWKRLPERIPSHYNAMGQPAAYGPRSGILFLPTVAWFLFILISAVACFPSAWNTVSGIRRENIPAALRLSKILIGTTRLGLSLSFAWMILCTARSVPMGAAALPLLLAVTFVPVMVIVALLLRLR